MFYKSISPGHCQSEVGSLENEIKAVNVHVRVAWTFSLANCKLRGFPNNSYVIRECRENELVIRDPDP